MTAGSILLPAAGAIAIVTARSLASKTHRMPYPYEYGSVAVIYGGAGLLAEASPPLGAAIAWGYLVALILTPSSANLLHMFGSAVGARGTPPTIAGTSTARGGTTP